MLTVALQFVPFRRSFLRSQPLPLRATATAKRSNAQSVRNAKLATLAQTFAPCGKQAEMLAKHFTAIAAPAVAERAAFHGNYIMQTTRSTIARGDHIKRAKTVLAPKPAGGKTRRIVVRSKPGKATPANKPAVAVKPARPAVANKPAATTNANDLAQRERERLAAAKAVAAFYSGVSLPFKRAGDLRRKAPINFALTRDPSARTAALLAAILTYCDVQADGTFVRGSGRVPGRLLGLTGTQANETFSAGPESGCLSNCIPDRIAYVSGATSGAGCELATFRISYDAARSNMLAHNTKQADGSHLFSAPLALLDKTITKRNKPAASAAKPASKPVAPVAAKPAAKPAAALRKAVKPAKRS